MNCAEPLLGALALLWLEVAPLDDDDPLAEGWLELEPDPLAEGWLELESDPLAEGWLELEPDPLAEGWFIEPEPLAAGGLELGLDPVWAAAGMANSAVPSRASMTCFFNMDLSSLV